ncbi:MAG: DUF2975 domain-containing protein [Sphingomonadales bacterium]|nr:DUF2975 domain-containing protein [Sphingomonadales bacterium]MBD3773011.1 DUF2975 domain-containing protein [Paracoccaceae bacterium]
MNSSKDPLLLAGKAIAIFMQGAMAFGGIALVIALVAVLVMQGTVNAEILEKTGDLQGLSPALTIAGLMVVGLAIVAMLFFFFDKLRRIIGTVGEGDPFQPQNATRLAQMGWLMLGVQLITLPAIPLAMNLAKFADHFENAHFTFNGGLDMSGILMAIVLFILARVFRHGTAMREDLEGTV